MTSHRLASIGIAAARLTALPIVVLSLFSALWLAVAPAGQDCFEVLRGTIASGPGLAICGLGQVWPGDVLNVLVLPTWVSWASFVNVQVLAAIYARRRRGGKRSHLGNGLILVLSLEFALSPTLLWMLAGVGCSSIAVEHGSSFQQDEAVNAALGFSSWSMSCGSPSNVPDLAILVWFFVAGCLMGISLLVSTQGEKVQSERRIQRRPAVLFVAFVGSTALAALSYAALVPTVVATSTCASLGLIRWWSGPGGYVCVVPDAAANSEDPGFLPALVVDTGGGTVASVFAIAIAIVVVSIFHIRSFKETSALWLIAAALSIPAGLVVDVYDSYYSCRAGEFSAVGGGSAKSVVDQMGILQVTCHFPAPTGVASISLWGPIHLSIAVLSIAIALGLAIFVLSTFRQQLSRRVLFDKR